MKTIQIKFLKTYNLMLAGLLALLGFASACESIIPEPIVEYGTPSAKFIVNGKIESEDSNTPIENIRVVMQGDTVMSDSEGKYQVTDKWGFPGDQTYKIEFRDIDGNLNGAYEDLDTNVEFKNPQYTGGDGKWYSGETATEFNIKLTSKK